MIKSNQALLGTGRVLASVVLTCLSLLSGFSPVAVADKPQAEVRMTGGFREPVLLIPEIGLWADAYTELGYGEDPGLLVWWGLEPNTAIAGGRYKEIDWSKVAFRVRAELYREDGTRVAREQMLVEPPTVDENMVLGGFPSSTHILIGQPGVYRARVEAYPLISPEDAGLDSLPSGVAEVEAVVAEQSIHGLEWEISDPMFLDSIEDWRPGGSAKRSWHEWYVNPSVPRTFSPDSTGAFVAFEIQRGDELVPRCEKLTCRVLISVFDDSGGVVQQTLRAVPEASSISAYLVPLETWTMNPETYRVEIHVYEGSQLLAGVARSFEIHGTATGQSD